MLMGPRLVMLHVLVFLCLSSDSVGKITTHAPYTSVRTSDGRETTNLVLIRLACAISSLQMLCVRVVLCSWDPWVELNTAVLVSGEAFASTRPQHHGVRRTHKLYASS